MNPSSRSLWTWGSAIVVTFFLHYAWEMGQASLYTNFAGMSFAEHALPCLWPTVVDVCIAVATYSLTAAVVRRSNWPLRPGWMPAALLWIGLGLVPTVVLEYRALNAGRWAYTSAMPVVLGIGLTPLMQWIIVPVVMLVVFRRLTVNFAGEP